MEVTPEVIAEWKEKHGSVYRQSLSDMDIYFRAITRDDYLEISANVATVGGDYEKETVKRCILNEVADKVFDVKGGVVSTIYEQLMIKSGFTNVEAEEL